MLVLVVWMALLVVVVMTETTQRQARMPSGAHQVISVCEAAKDKLEEVIGYMET